MHSKIVSQHFFNFFCFANLNCISVYSRWINKSINFFRQLHFKICFRFFFQLVDSFLFCNILKFKPHFNFRNITEIYFLHFFHHSASEFLTRFSQSNNFYCEIFRLSRHQTIITLESNFFKEFFRFFK